MAKQLSRDEILNWWLQKYHNISVDEVLEKYPEEAKTPDWFKLFPVTKEQHDEWYDWVINKLAKKHHKSREWTRRQFAMPYLDCAPYCKDL